MDVRTPSELGALIRSRRRGLGIDQASLARSAGVSRYWIMDVERGKPTAAIGFVFRALRCLGLAVEIREQVGATGRKQARSTGRKVDVDALIAATLEHDDANGRKSVRPSRRRGDVASSSTNAPTKKR